MFAKWSYSYPPPPSVTLTIEPRMVNYILSMMSNLIEAHAFWKSCSLEPSKPYITQIWVSNQVVGLGTSTLITLQTQRSYIIAIDLQEING
jgi:hypothetical protein